MSRRLYRRFHQGTTPVLPAMPLSPAPRDQVSPKGKWSLLVLIPPLMFWLYPEFKGFSGVKPEYLMLR